MNLKAKDNFISHYGAEIGIVLSVSGDFVQLGPGSVSSIAPMSVGHFGPE